MHIKYTAYIYIMDITSTFTPWFSQDNQRITHLHKEVAEWFQCSPAVRARR